ncbi:hypothetical protein K523DRAFT_139816 [Schizophyllum commune Tattone D]|nr:hypothetical protein K523DRAFT_139816 [Schizophyllum commune Tattone D]
MPMRIPLPIILRRAADHALDIRPRDFRVLEYPCHAREVERGESEEEVEVEDSRRGVQEQRARPARECLELGHGRMRADGAARHVLAGVDVLCRLQVIVRAAGEAAELGPVKVRSEEERVDWDKGLLLGAMGAEIRRPLLDDGA